MHVALFASKADLTPAQITSLMYGTATVGRWPEDRPAVADDAAPPR